MKIRSDATKLILYKYIQLVSNKDDSEEINSLNIKRCRSIDENKFWFSKPGDLNDPFECQPLFSSLKSYEEAEILVQELDNYELAALLKLYPSINSPDQLLRELRDCLKEDKNSFGRTFKIWQFESIFRQVINLKMSNIGILSLSETYQNNLMWSHYSNNHQGICIEIDLPKTSISLKKVTYTDSQPCMPLYKAMHERHGMIEQLFYHKSKHWSYEKEWRLVSLEGNKLGEIEGANIQKIYFGLNTSEQTKNFIMENISRPIITKQLEMGFDYSIS